MQQAHDKFSGVAEGYRKFRPDYPEALYQDLLESTHQRACAWDAGTGNGQVAVVPVPIPVQLQSHGPLPVTAVALPALQRLVSGAVANVPPFAEPQVPLTA